MNILVPDSWLREYLETKATPKQIKEYLSLCGPSVERIHEQTGKIIYNIEITGNRPDAMSVAGVAREAAAILPRFGIAAKLRNEPYAARIRNHESGIKNKKNLTIKTDPVLNPRWTSVVFDNVAVKPSPDWLTKKLEATGIRSINTIIDVTNYLMRAYGQPAHAFDFDAIADKTNHATMILRASKKGEKLVTLDGKSHVLPGDDIVIEDGKGRLIDLCGVMGGENSAVKPETKTVILFLQTYEPIHIRRTMMALGHRTEAGGLFEKGTDPELVMPAFIKGVELIMELSGGTTASRIWDIYPKPYKPYTVSVTRAKADAYIGKHLTDTEIIDILKPLGFNTKVSKNSINVTVPSFRRDVTIDVDIIEELARMYGYHNITATLPHSAPPITIPDPQLTWEEEIKTRLRDWGYTETYTYSMISEELMDVFGLDKSKAYKINNPLNNEWVYMRPTLFPSMLAAIKQNLNVSSSLKLFELSNVYLYRENELPQETPVLIIAWTGRKFTEAKGIAQAIFSLFGLELPPPPMNIRGLHDWDNQCRLLLNNVGSVSEVNRDLLLKLGIDQPVTIFWTHTNDLIINAKSSKAFRPIPKYPPSFEDLAFVLPPQTQVGPILDAFKTAHPLVSQVRILDTYETTTTFHITYQSPEKNLTTADLRPAREKLIAIAEKQFHASLKTV
jgi:phenylalanyl-tRNA synthetase beta chain